MSMYVTGSGAGQKELVQIYDREHLFEPAERDEPRFWDDIQDAEEIRPGGRGVTYRVVGATGHAVGNPAEGGDYSVSRTMLNVQLTTTSAQVDATIQLSAKFVEAAKDDGSFYGDAEAEGMIETTLSFFRYLDVLLGAGYGTLQLGTVAAAVTTSTVVQMDTDEWTYQLNPNQPVEFWFSGSKEHTAIIESIDNLTGIIVLDTAGTISAGAGVFQDDVHGNPAPNGLRSIVDDDTLASSIDGGLRADFPFLNAVGVGTAGAGADDFTEESIDELLDLITWGQKKVPTELRLNNGLFRAWKKITRNDRMMMLPGKGAVSADGGTKGEAPAFYYGDSKIPFRLDRNLPGRTLYALYKPGFRRNILRKPDWFSEKGGPIFDKIPGDSGVGYKYAYVGAMMADINISCRCYNANGIRRGYKDPAFGDV